MSVEGAYPREWLEQVTAVVFASLRAGELRLIVHPGKGLADGGVPYDVPTERIPIELRLPNTALWVQFDGKMNILRVWRREE